MNNRSLHILAEEMMKTFPIMGKLVSTRLRESGEDEATLMQMRVLHQLEERPTTASELAKRRQVSLQSVSVLIQSMVERGWIVRVPDVSDRRQFLLQVTPEGLAKAATTRNQILDYITDLFEELSPEEVAAAQIFLLALSRILTQHITTDSSEEPTPL